MADEPEKTPIQSVFAQQFTEALAANRTEQEDVTAQLAGLQKRLDQLRSDEAWLTQAQGSLPTALDPSAPEVEPAAGAAESPTSAEAVTDAPQSVPQQRQDQPVKAAQSKQKPAKKTAATKNTTTAKKPAAGKSTAKKAAAKKTTATRKEAVEKVPAEAAPTVEVTAEEPAPKEKSGPPLHELVLAILLKTPGEPRQAREVFDELNTTHPGRAASVQVVRNQLNNLTGKSRIETSLQGNARMYTAYGDAGAASAADPAAGGEGEQVPETAAEKVPAEV
ncbi:hypothetical protein OG613_49190 (plasmid) [Streptomyces sp. NBC_00015]|uniref:hypothetical protein n=1 Tax=Streptomyces sp. NBC_00015 TaxID=2903611 RepID=UPI002F9127F7